MNTTETDPRGGVASRIRETRLGAGLTQAELAARVGVTAGTVSSWEAGRSKPSQEHQEAIVVQCRTGAADLAGGEAPGRRRRSPVQLMSREERMRAVVDVIARHVAEHGYAPSMQEMGDETGFSSTSVVASSLDACEEAGLIVRGRRMARAVALTEAGRAFAEAPPETGGPPPRREDLAFERSHALR
ncbi:MAG: helix-turn-helix domain-containing protein [Chloroflexi bacterium]|nr:helix-turn-helix domain-containing protein [Chloroflexota bacterium]